MSKTKEQKLEEAVTNNILNRFDDKWMDNLVEKITEKLEKSFKVRFDKQEEKIGMLEKDITTLKTEIEELKLEKDNMEQYNRRNNIRIFGVQEKNQENVLEVLQKLFTENLNSSVSTEDIEICHRVGTKIEKKARPILVKFKENSTRNKIYYSKKALKGTKIVIREDLSKKRIGLVKTAVEEFGHKNVWTQNGRVYVFQNNRKHVIKDTECILSLIE